jgi:hypothetical protein
MMMAAAIATQVVSAPYKTALDLHGLLHSRVV